MIVIEDFKRLDLRIGTVLEATEHPNADRLLLLRVDLGEEQPRQVVAGIKSAYSPDSLIGRQIVICTNLEPAVIRGETSNGMLLAACNGADVKILVPDGALPNGSSIS